MILQILGRDERTKKGDRTTRRFERPHRKGQWHRKWLLFPRWVKLEGRPRRRIIWLTSIYARKSTSRRRWLYALPDDYWGHRTWW